MRTNIQEEQPSIDTMLAEVTEQDGRACVEVSDINGYAALSDAMLSVGGQGEEMRAYRLVGYFTPEEFVFHLLKVAAAQ